MTDYSEYSDEELIGRIRSGEEELLDYVIVKYMPLVRSIAKSDYGKYSEDFIQEGLIGLYNAIRNYDEKKDAAFSTFANLCIKRRMASAYKTMNRLKNRPLNDYVSLYSNDEDEEIQLINALINFAEKNPEELYIGKELMTGVKDIMDNDMSSLESDAMKLFIAGNSMAEITEKLGRDEKSVDNALQRAKSKLRKGLDL